MHKDHELFWLFELVTRQHNEVIELIHHKTTHIMATLQELNDAITALQTSVDTKQAAIATAISALEAQIASGSAATPDDLQAVIDRLKTVQADVDSTPTA